MVFSYRRRKILFLMLDLLPPFFIIIRKLFKRNLFSVILIIDIHFILCTNVFYESINTVLLSIVTINYNVVYLNIFVSKLVNVIVCFTLMTKYCFHFHPVFNYFYYSLKLSMLICLLKMSRQAIYLIGSIYNKFLPVNYLH